MEATAQSQKERAELNAVLESGIFHKAPNLSSFLVYICERHFEGAADQIKEYNIAVDALGRRGDFDQKKDSIVRVEAHRLRKRLSEYYATDGAEHAIQIAIPNGQYAPQFIAKSGLEIVQTELPERALQMENPGAAPEVLPPDPVALPTSDRAGKRFFQKWSYGLLGLLILAAGVYASFVVLDRPKANPPVPDEIWKGTAAEPVSSEFRMLAGYQGQPFTDRQGHKWEPDAYYTGGHSVAINPPKVIEGLPDPELFHTLREGSFRYDIPLRNGTYELHLLFAETNYGKGNPSEGDEVRSFNVDLNGSTKLDLFDALSEAGAPNRLHVRVFKDVSPAKDGKLHLAFRGRTGQAFLNALEILSGVPGRIRPIRIVARKTPVIDADGHVWSGDEYVVGGHLVERRDSISNVRQKNLYEGERFGNFRYQLPVAPGKYRIKLYFAETYFGSGLLNAPKLEKGARLFDVFANGVALLQNFDIGVEAGGVNRGIVREFLNLEPDAQGLIILEFRPISNYACVNAIEVEEME